MPHLDAIYGSRAPRVQALAAADPALACQLAPGYPDIAAEVVFSASHEWCQRADDFLLRRSYLGFGGDRGESALRSIDAALASARLQA